jgi:hypothetical protein
MRVRWTEEEEDKVLLLFSAFSKDYIFKMLPNKDWSQITSKASQLGVHRYLESEHIPEYEYLLSKMDEAVEKRKKIRPRYIRSPILRRILANMKLEQEKDS